MGALLILTTFFVFGNFFGMTSATSECCAHKEVGEYVYTLVNSTLPVPTECINGCAYVREGQLGGPYCFAPGYLPVKCKKKDFKCLYGLEARSGYTYGPEIKRWYNRVRRQTDEVWQPILNCFTGFALTPESSSLGSTLITKPMPGAENPQPTPNQLWRMDSERRIINKESGLVITDRGGYLSASMQEATPINSYKKWKVRTDIRSDQETELATVPKLVPDTRPFCLATNDRFTTSGSATFMWPADTAHPGNACWNAAFETEKEGCSGGVVVRRNVLDITKPTEIANYNLALKTIKDHSSDNEEQYENIANYHGAPYMCNDGQTKVELNGYGVCCINHQYISGLYELFTPWHRLFVRQMELSLNKATANSLGIPYWDWTQEDSLPSFAQQGQWKNGPIKGTGDITYRTCKDPNNCVNSIQLAKLVKTAYITATTTIEFNNQIVDPHNNVHGSIGGSMRTFGSAAYDPIFYLHHSEVDYQYAFWQAIQNIRKKPVTYTKAAFEMQPFTMQPTNSKFKNPFELTREKSTAPDGVYYEQQLCYKYDKLLFKGKTPQEIHEEGLEERKKPSFYAGHTDKYIGITSRQYFNLADTKGSRIISEEIGPTSTFGDTGEAKLNNKGFYPNNFLYDVTDILGNGNTDPADKTLHFEVTRYEDYEGNPLGLENTYKPTAIYRKENTDAYVFRFHVDHIERYSPKIIYCHLDSAVEFLNTDGSFSRQVTLESDEPGKARRIVGDFPIQKSKNKFVVEGNQRSGESASITVGYFPGCHLQCDSEGIPISSDPDVVAVPWNLRWIKCHENMKEITSCPDAAVIIAWCHGQETDIVELSSKKDFDDCTNLGEVSPQDNDSDGHVDGFIAIKHTKDSVGTFYYASRSLCKLGFKIAIKITKCLP